jgi:hypothetical protein
LQLPEVAVRVSVILWVVALLFSLPGAFSLGISPALKHFEYVPGGTEIITFAILSDDPSRGVSIQINGDFAPYASLSKNRTYGTENVVLTIQYPQTPPEPGTHYFTVFAREDPPENEFIGTLVEVGALIDFFVPYPGRYAEVSVFIPDVNAGERIPVEMHVINRGTNELDISKAHIEFLSSVDGSTITALDFKPVVLAVSGEQYYRQYFDSQILGPGRYIARGRVYYEKVIRESNHTFQVGTLFVNITNYTSFLLQGGVRPFKITVNSQWNSPLPTIFADVNLSNGTGNILSFRAPPISLGPWGSETMNTFIDTTSLLGVYSLSITLHYGNQISTFVGPLVIGTEESHLILYIVMGVVIILVALVALYLFILFHRHFNRKNKRS